ncbi:MAG: sigma-70 family RNA polymerase sigma factor [Kiritimatiellae bacterium]|nr:sigma-70 family RNA polymerase sigma factor [Kiritimatiellia bacterium]
MSEAIADTAADHELLSLFLAERSEEALRALIARHSAMVLGTCRRGLGGDADLARDAAQAVFILLAQRAGRIRNRHALASWLFWTARSVAAHMTRAEQRRKGYERTAAAVEAARQRRREAACRPGAEYSVDEAVAALPEPSRTAVVLHVLQGLTHGEAAGVLGCSKGAVAMRISRALGKMRAVLR